MNQFQCKQGLLSNFKSLIAFSQDNKKLLTILTLLSLSSIIYSKHFKKKLFVAQLQQFVNKGLAWLYGKFLFFNGVSSDFRTPNLLNQVVTVVVSEPR